MFDRVFVEQQYPNRTTAQIAHNRWHLVLPVMTFTGITAAFTIFGAPPALALLLLFVPVYELLAQPASTVQRRQTAAFVLIVAGATLAGWPGAIAVGLTSLFIEHLLTGVPGGYRRSLRPLVFIGLVSAGTLVSTSMQGLVRPLMLVWMIVICVWLADRMHARRLVMVLPAAAALIWLFGLLTLDQWLPLLVNGEQPRVDDAMTGLAFAIGLMTADSIFGSALGLRRQGLAGLRFWRTEFMPTFARYNAMALAGAVTGTLLLPSDALQSVLAVCGLLALALILALIRDLRSSHHQLVATVCALSSALDARDRYTRGHSDRVASYAVAIARHLGWSTRKLRQIELAGHLHDVGKIGVPDAVLLKPGRLTPDEYATIQNHVEGSVAVVRNIPELRGIATDILQHHERLDGSGYPHGLSGEDISQAARILGVADSFDAMTSTRSYRPAMPVEQALRLIKAEAGTKYDQAIVDALILLNQEGDIEGMLAYTYCLSH